MLLSNDATDWWFVEVEFQGWETLALPMKKLEAFNLTQRVGRNEQTLFVPELRSQTQWNLDRTLFQR